jgi:hypothetical protein
LSLIHATCPALPLLDLITRMIFGEEYRSTFWYIRPSVVKYSEKLSIETYRKKWKMRVLIWNSWLMGRG